MKEFVMIFRNSASMDQAAPSPEQMQQVMTAWMAWMTRIEEGGNMAQRGSRLGTQGAQVLRPGGVITDGPFTEIKEFINGYTILKTNTIEEAVEIAGGCPALQIGGSVEVRPVVAADDHS